MARRSVIMNDGMPKSVSDSSLKMLFALVTIGLVCAFLIVITFEKTLPVIALKKKEALDKAIFQVVPGISTTKTFIIENGKLLPASNEESREKIHAGFNENGKLIGLAIEASGQGYADVIRILYGYNIETQKVVGIQILETKETPGLGDKIEKDPSFLENFKALDVSLNANGTQLAHQVITVKNGKKNSDWEIEGITGATISSRAIGEIIQKSTSMYLPVIQANAAQLISDKVKDGEI